VQIHNDLIQDLSVYYSMGS